MIRSLAFRLLAAAATLGAAAGSAAAQPVVHPQGRLGLAVVGPIGAAELRPALGELGVEITDEADFAPDLGRLTITIGATDVRISYQPAAGSLVERTLELPASREDQVELIGYVATNLVRDQAGELLAGLRAPIVIPPLPPPSVNRIEPHTTVHVPASIGFVPPLSVDRIGGSHVVVGVALNALVGTTDGSDIASISGLVDVQREFASGIQIGGLAATAGRVDAALQIGGLAALSRHDADGVQIGGLVSAAGGNVSGAQLAGLAAAARGRMDGMQIAGLATVADSTRGMQIAGVANAANRVSGMQIAGVANVGGDVSGAQIGLVNVARKMHGVQVGLVNISEDGDDAYPIGLINYAKNGRVTVDGWVESDRLSAVALRHGTRHIHNVWGIAWSPDADHLLAGAGLGTHLALAGGLGLDVDAMNWWTDVWHGNTGQLDQLRATLSLPVGPVEIIGGAAANVYISDPDKMDESASFNPVWARRVTSDGGTHVVTWPSVFAGVRLRAK